jgi:multidrug efflux system outer membrane protein
VKIAIEFRSFSLVRMLATALAANLLGGCASGLFGNVGPDYTQPSLPPAPAAWHARQPEDLPHAGSMRQLADWWAQFRDPALDAMLAAAQSESNTLAQAAATIERSRADAVAAGSTALPGVEGIASANRAAFSFGGPAAQRTQYQVGVQSSWEIDLFGGLARQRESATATLEANVAAWHDARVSLAAEVANAYVNLRHCEILVAQAVADSSSRASAARAADALGKAGLQARATVALAQASAAEAAAILVQRRAQCDIFVKGLVALTAMDENALRALLAKSGTGKLPEPQRFRVDSIPARVVAQRPDVAAAERRVAAASADIGRAEAERYPRLTLAGSITPTRISIDSAPALSLTTWSIGPSVVLPLFDGGRRSANVDAFRAQYAAADANYRARVRAAVREVEEALVRLASAAEREANTLTAARGYRTNFEGAQIRLDAGFGNVVELEDARRLWLAAEAAVAALAQERVAAWVALYRAVGGGWTTTESTDREPPARVLPERKPS